MTLLGACVRCVAGGVAFGYWQHSLHAGVWMLGCFIYVECALKLTDQT